MIKLQLPSSQNFRSKDWWLKELKQIRWTEVLLLIVILLMYFQNQHMIKVNSDPCSFCIINRGNDNIMTCKDYFKPVDYNKGGENELAFDNLFVSKDTG